MALENLHGGFNCVCMCVRWVRVGVDWALFPTAQVKLLVRIVPAVVVAIAFPVRLDAHVVLALKQEGGAVRAVGEAGRCEFRSGASCVTSVVKPQQRASFSGGLRYSRQDVSSV